MAGKYLATFGVTVALGLAVSATNQESRESKADFYGWVFATSQSDVVHAGQHFREDVFGKEPLYVSRDFNRNYFESTLSVDKIWPQLSTKTSDASSLAEKGNVIDIRVGGTKATATPEMRAVLSNPVDSHKSIPTKHSFIIRFEELEDQGEALDELRRRISTESVGSEVGSVHGYYSGPGGTKALMPHTDPYDVVVLQIAGSKQWTTCVPSTPSNVTSAMRAKAYAKEHTNGKSCVTHDTASLNSMVCNHFVMRAGDALYLPRDIVHYAETTDEASVHLTIGFGGDDGECDTQDAMDSFTADVVQRSRRASCSKSTDPRATSCDQNCDSWCDLSCDYCSYGYNDYSSCDSCDSSCDSSCDTSCDSSCTSTSGVVTPGNSGNVNVPDVNVPVVNVPAIIYTTKGSTFWSSSYDDDDASYSATISPLVIIIPVVICIVICCCIAACVYMQSNGSGGGSGGGSHGVPAPVYGSQGGGIVSNPLMIGTAVVGSAAVGGILAHKMSNNSENANDGGGFSANDLPDGSY